MGDRVTSIGGVDVLDIAGVKFSIAACRARGDTEVEVCCEAGAVEELPDRPAQEPGKGGRRGSWAAGAPPGKEATSATTSAAAAEAHLANLVRLAKKGDAAAQNDLAVAYHRGGGAAGRDDGEAVRWWAKAARQGHTVAMVSLGTANYTGRGVGASGLPDYDEAVRLWQVSSAAVLLADMLAGVGGMAGRGFGWR